jgi:hypothetical protein
MDNRIEGGAEYRKVNFGEIGVLLHCIKQFYKHGHSKQPSSLPEYISDASNVLGGGS